MVRYKVVFAVAITTLLVLSQSASPKASGQDAAPDEYPVIEEGTRPTAYEYNMRGDYKMALDTSIEVFSSTASDSMNSLLAAYAMRGLESHEGSIAFSTLALEHATASWQSVDALVGRAASYIALGKRSAALEDLKSAERAANLMIADAPDEALPYYQMACVCSMKSRYSEQDKQRAAEMRKSAIAYLTIAMQNGYDKLDHARNDLDLTPLQSEQSFVDLTKQ